MRQHPFLAVLPTALLLAALVMAPGCDKIRASLGKPTSAEIEAIRQAQEAREQAVRDSIAAAQAAAEAAALAEQEAATPVIKRFYAVAGSFREEANISRTSALLEKHGFPVCILEFKNGMRAVCIDGHETIAEAQRDKAALVALDLDAVPDPWIYDTNQRLHIEQ